MKHPKSITLILSCLMMLCCVLYADFMIQGASAGVQMCLQSVLPALFPFIFLSGIIKNSLPPPSASGNRYGKLFAPGTRMYWLIGVLGGYPIGAKMLNDGAASGTIDGKEANRMLLFCNQAGPAFLFGIVGRMLDSVIIGLVLWLIQIFASLVIACIVPVRNRISVNMQQPEKQSVSSILMQSLKAMGVICGWIILFKSFLAMLDPLLSRYLPGQAQILITGMLEITNGIYQLKQIPDPAIRFILANLFISSGGVCVALQTAGVCRMLNFRMYIIGKIMQIFITIPISVLVAFSLFGGIKRFYLVVSFLILSSVFVAIIHKMKITTGKIQCHRVE